MKLAFCDDRPNTVSFIADYIRDYFISVSIPLEIKIYDDAMELVRDTATALYTICICLIMICPFCLARSL